MKMTRKDGNEFNTNSAMAHIVERNIRALPARHQAGEKAKSRETWLAEHEVTRLVVRVQAIAKKMNIPGIPGP